MNYILKMQWIGKHNYKKYIKWIALQNYVRGFGKSYLNVKIVHFSSATIYSKEMKFSQVIYKSFDCDLT